MSEKNSPESISEPNIIPDIMFTDKFPEELAGDTLSSPLLSEDESLYLLQARSSLDKGKLPEGISRDFSIGRGEQISQLSKRTEQLLSDDAEERDRRREYSMKRQADLRAKREAIQSGKLAKELKRVGDEAKQNEFDKQMSNFDERVDERMSTFDSSMPGSGPLLRHFARQDVETEAKEKAESAARAAKEARSNEVRKNGGAATIGSLRGDEGKEKARKDFKERIGVVSLNKNSDPEDEIDEAAKKPSNEASRVPLKIDLPFIDLNDDNDKGLLPRWDPPLPKRSSIDKAPVYSPEYIKKLEEEFQSAVKQMFEISGDDKRRLMEEASILGMELYECKITNSILDLKNVKDDYERSLKVAEIEEYISLFLRTSSVDERSEEALALRKMLSVNSWEKDNVEEIEKAFEEFEEKRNTLVEQQILINRENRKQNNDTAEPVIKTRWQKFREKLQLPLKKEQDKMKYPLMRKAIGALALTGVLSLTYGIYKLNNQDGEVMVRYPRTGQELYDGGQGSSDEKLPNFSNQDNDKITTVNNADVQRMKADPEGAVQEIAAINKTLKSRGIPAEIRTDIIENFSDFKRMAENPEQFQQMIGWYNDRVAELMQNDSNMSREQAEKIAKNQGLQYFAKISVYPK